jgi:hypothetical protein
MINLRRNDDLGLQVNGVLRFVFQVRPAILHLPDAKPSPGLLLSTDQAVLHVSDWTWRYRYVRTEKIVPQNCLSWRHRP